MPSDRRRGQRGPSRYRQEILRQLATAFGRNPDRVVAAHPRRERFAEMSREATATWPTRVYLAYRDLMRRHALARRLRLDPLRAITGPGWQAARLKEVLDELRGFRVYGGLVDLPEALQTTSAVRHAWAPDDVALWAFLHRHLGLSFTDVERQVELDTMRLSEPERYRPLTGYAAQKLVYENLALWEFADRAAA